MLGEYPLQIYEEVQEIINSYDVVPKIECTSKSIIDEISHCIVDYVILNGDTIEEFDFDSLFKNVDMGKWA